MWTIYVDADACPVKAETYRVADRYKFPILVVSKFPIPVPAEDLISLVVKPGFGEVDDWIAETAEAGDLVVSNDIPLAARCIERGALVVDSKGRLLTERTIGDALASRDLMTELRNAGTVSGGPSALTKQDRSRFLATLDQLINFVKRRHRAKPTDPPAPPPVSE
ncbi:MAG: YaiI/YqxD family protein [Planctomycetia bacterium]